MMRPAGTQTALTRIPITQSLSPAVGDLAHARLALNKIIAPSVIVATEVIKEMPRVGSHTAPGLSLNQRMSRLPGNVMPESRTEIYQLKVAGNRLPREELASQLTAVYEGLQAEQSLEQAINIAKTVSAELFKIGDQQVRHVATVNAYFGYWEDDEFGSMSAISGPASFQYNLADPLGHALALYLGRSTGLLLEPIKKAIRTPHGKVQLRIEHEFSELGMGVAAFLHGYQFLNSLGDDVTVTTTENGWDVSLPPVRKP